MSTQFDPNTATKDALIRFIRKNKLPYVPGHNKPYYFNQVQEYLDQLQTSSESARSSRSDRVGRVSSSTTTQNNYAELQARRTSGVGTSVANGRLSLNASKPSHTTVAPLLDNSGDDDEWELDMSSSFEVPRNPFQAAVDHKDGLDGNDVRRVGTRSTAMQATQTNPSSRYLSTRSVSPARERLPARPSMADSRGAATKLNESAYELPVNPLDQSALEVKRRISFGRPAPVDDINPFQRSSTPAASASSSSTTAYPTSQPSSRTDIYSRMRKSAAPQQDEKIVTPPKPSAKRGDSAWELTPDGKMKDLLNVPARVPTQDGSRSSKERENAARTTASSIRSFFQSLRPQGIVSASPEAKPRTSLPTTHQRSRASFGLPSLFGEDPENDAQRSEPEDEDDNNLNDWVTTSHRRESIPSADNRSSLTDQHSQTRSYDIARESGRKGIRSRKEVPENEQSYQPSVSGVRHSSRTRKPPSKYQADAEEPQGYEDRDSQSLQDFFSPSSEQSSVQSRRFTALAIIFLLTGVLITLVYYLFQAPTVTYCDSPGTATPSHSSLAEVMKHPSSKIQNLDVHPENVSVTQTCLECPPFAVCRDGTPTCPTPLVLKTASVPLVSDSNHQLGTAAVATCSPNAFFDYLADTLRAHAGRFECAPLAVEDITTFGDSFTQAMASLPLPLQPFGFVVRHLIVSPLISGAERVASYILPAARETAAPREPYLTRADLEKLLVTQHGQTQTDAHAALGLFFDVLKSPNRSIKFPQLNDIRIDPKAPNRLVSNSPTRSLACSIRRAVISPASIIFFIFFAIVLRMLWVSVRRITARNRRAELLSDLEAQLLKRLEDALNDRISASDALEELREERLELLRLKSQQAAQYRPGFQTNMASIDARLMQVTRMIEETTTKVAVARNKVFLPIQLMKKELFDAHNYQNLYPGLWTEVTQVLDANSDVALVRRPVDGAPSWVLKEALVAVASVNQTLSPVHTNAASRPMSPSNYPQPAYLADSMASPEKGFDQQSQSHVATPIRSPQPAQPPVTSTSIFSRLRQWLPGLSQSSQSQSGATASQPSSPNGTRTLPNAEWNAYPSLSRNDESFMDRAPYIGVQGQYSSPPSYASGDYTAPPPYQ